MEVTDNQSLVFISFFHSFVFFSLLENRKLGPSFVLSLSLSHHFVAFVLLWHLRRNVLAPWHMTRHENCKKAMRGTRARILILLPAKVLRMKNDCGSNLRLSTAKKENNGSTDTGVAYSLTWQYHSTMKCTCSPS